ncbi:efflux RND transporter periplasmic adaptor subunit [Paenibacillus sp. GCM10023250]|uniref:efflux RND transporter periplasmic adaptor subunit n=1 Tax=Paenibacillus sp. GCM10023250 TaxID=3252648 RepID=UPI003609F61C
MIPSVQTDPSASRKRIIRWIAGLLFGSLIVLTLFSNTLYSLTLPKVTVERPSAGSLNPEFKGSATLAYVSELDLSNPEGGKVQQVLVKEGEEVKKGQPLILYRNDDTVDQLDSERDTLTKLQLPIESLQRAYIEAANAADPAAQSAARTALESAKTDMAAQERRIQRLESRLAEQRELKAPFDGVIESVHAVEGMPSGSGEADVRIADMEKGLQFELQVPVYMASVLNIGNPLEVVAEDKIVRSVQGTLMEIGEFDSEAAHPDQADAETVRLHVGLHDKTLRAGDRVELKLELQGNEDALIISSEAVHKDRDGAYVFVIDDRKGPLGNARYARKVSVTISAVYDSSTAVVDSLSEDESVIRESSEPLSDGTQVRY